jgi:hypothetical protein
LKPLEVFCRDAIDPHGHHLLVSVGSAAHYDVVTHFQIFQREFLWLLPLLPLAEMCLIVHQHRLRGPIGLLDLKAINPHRGDGSHHRRRATHPAPTRFFSRGWGILLCGQRTGKT